jgi:hypothetical protein
MLKVVWQIFGNFDQFAILEICQYLLLEVEIDVLLKNI